MVVQPGAAACCYESMAGCFVRIKSVCLWRRTMKQILVLLLLCTVWASAARAGQAPDTGQTKCYGMTGEIACPEPGEPFYGQDAQHGTAAQRSFVKFNAQGQALPDDASSWSMVRDTETGLVWEVKDSKDGSIDYGNPHDADNRYTWYEDNASRNGGDPGMPGEGTDTSDFIGALNSQSFGGYSDWRLPSAKELIWVLDRGVDGPLYIWSSYFPNAADEYWTATTDPSSSSRCATATLKIGMMNYPGKTASYAAMAVRGSSPPPQFRNNGDGTVSDISTGLMWQKNSVQGISWQDALAYCSGLKLGGHSDWRLPDVNELISLVDYSQSSPSIDEQYFTNTALHYWSSTSYPTDPGKAYHVCFLRGRTEVYGKTDQGLSSHLRAVRSIAADNSSTTTTIPHSLCPVEKLYGENAPQTRLLRMYRDEVLASSAPGRLLIVLYNRISPMVNRHMIRKSFEMIVRTACDSIVAVLVKSDFCSEQQPELSKK